jgi:hypothetical protein
VLPVNPIIELVKLPAPAPSVVLLSATVGVKFVLQHTPRAVTVAPPSDVIVPPHCAVVGVIALTAPVVTEGTGVVGAVDLSFEQAKNSSNDAVKDPIKTKPYFRIISPSNNS